MSMRQDNEFCFDVSKDIRQRQVDIYMVVQHYDLKKISLAHPSTLEMMSLEEAEDRPKTPMLSLSYDGVADLMDQLWYAGIRPTREVTKFGAEERGALAAHIKTLEDQVLFLRSIIDHQLGKIR